MAFLFIVAFPILILNLALPGSSFDYRYYLEFLLIVTLTGSTFACGTSWQYFGL